MILEFFKRSEFPDGAAAHLMQMFRDYRMELDQEKLETSYRDPDTGEVR